MGRQAPRGPTGVRPVVKDPMGPMSGTSGKAGWHATVTPPGISPDDRELVERLLAGEEAAFAGLVNQYHASLVRLARGFVASRDVAEEVAQETWLAVLTGLASFEGRSALKTWIFHERLDDVLVLVGERVLRGVEEPRRPGTSGTG
ncbi:MAG: hypothetical protein HYS05_14320 [Acidobacteria bacterium]|nr:hypothetical protein [Acidobacteriota bacterium]